MPEFRKGQAQKGKFRCGTCGKTFDSVQALGGHQATHRAGKAAGVAQATQAVSTPAQAPTDTGPPTAAPARGAVWPTWDEMKAQAQPQAQAGAQAAPGVPQPKPGVVPLQLGLGRLIARVISRVFPEEPVTPDEEKALSDAFDNLVGVPIDKAPPYIILPFDISPIIAVVLLLLPRFWNKMAKARKEKAESGKGGVVSSSQVSAGTPPSPAVNVGGGKT